MFWGKILCLYVLWLAYETMGTNRNYGRKSNSELTEISHSRMMVEEAQQNRNIVPTTCKCVAPPSKEALPESQKDEHGDAEPEFKIAGGIDVGNFRNKTALVSGPLTEVGRQVIKELCEQKVVVIAIGGTKTELLNLKKSFSNIEVVPVDLKNWSKTSMALSSLGHLDFLVNCEDTNIINSVADITEEDVDHIFNANLKGIINITRIAVRIFIEKAIRGSIVNISSQAAMAGLRKQAVYCASKAGLDGYTRAAALELGSFGIRINCVNPTVLKSELEGNIWSDTRMSDPMLSRIPLKRFCEPQEVSAVVMFLLSEQAAMITGVSFPVDGGFCSC